MSTFGQCEAERYPKLTGEAVPFERTKWVWMNGDLVRWADATVHVSVHGLHYGSGVFEGIRCYETADGPAVFRLDAHLDRLYSSAAAYGLEIPYTREQLAAAACRVIASNAFTSCYVRPICLPGSSTLGLVPQNCPIEVVILTWPWEPLLGVEALEAGVRVTISPWLKFHRQMMPTTAKACGQYLNSILAARDAVSRGYHEALLLGADGSIAEGPGENLFVVRQGKLLTNDERHSVLLGVTRDTVLEIARDLGYPIEIRALELEDLLSADEAFFTGTAAEVTPIREMDGKLIGRGGRGPVTERIQQTFFRACSGRDPKYKSWLRIVAPNSKARPSKLGPIERLQVEREYR